MLATTNRIIDGIGRAQLGLVTWPRLLEAGLSPKEIIDAQRIGVLIVVQHGVYRTSGTPPSWEQALLASCLAAGPMARGSHRASSRRWELVEGEAPLEITVPLAQCPTPRHTILHRSTDLVPEHCTVRGGIPITTPARTLLDLGAVEPAEVVAAAVEVALYKRYATVKGLRLMLDEFARPGRRGCGVLRHVLDDRALGDARPESRWEPVVARVVKAFGVEGVVYQHEVLLAGQKKRIDFGIPEALVGVEMVGLEAHASRAALDNDLARQNLLQGTGGWLILGYTSTHLRRPAQVAREIIRVATERRDFLRSLQIC
jgi:hypothetical protein